MILLLLLLPLLFLLAVHGQDSRNEEPRVVVIAIDGLRWQEVFEGARRDSLMPFLWKMGEEKGCMMGNRNRKSRMEVENGIWKSYAGYSEMLCGVTDDEHIFDNRKQYTPPSVGAGNGCRIARLQEQGECRGKLGRNALHPEHTPK